MVEKSLRPRARPESESPVAKSAAQPKIKVEKLPPKKPKEPIRLNKKRPMSFSGTTPMDAKKRSKKQMDTAKSAASAAAKLLGGPAGAIGSSVADIAEEAMGMKYGGKVKKMKSGGKVRGYKYGGKVGNCRGGGAAVSGTKFSGCK